MHKGFISGVGLLFAAGFSAPATAQSLDALLADLEKNHPRIQAEQENVQSAEAAVTEAMANYFPKVDLNGSYGYENTDRTKLLVAAGEFDLNPANAGLSVSQNLFEGFRTKGSVDSAESNFNVAKATYESTKQQVFFEAVSNYLAVLRQIKLTEFAKRNMKTLQNQLNLEDEKVQRGSGIAVDVLQAKSRLQISKERFTAFTGGLQDAMANYSQTFGSIPDVETMALPDIPLDELPPTLEEALDIARNNNPLLLASNYTTEAAEHQKTVAKAGYFPTVDVIASSNYRDDAGGIQGEEQSNSAVVQASWQLFSGFADQARSKQAVHGYQSALSTAADTRRRVEEEVKLAWSNMNTSKERAELLENAVNIAGEVYDARKRLRDAGSDTALNVLDAENELFRAEIDASAARFDYYTSIYRLLLAMGRLDMGTI